MHIFDAKLINFDVKLLNNKRFTSLWCFFHIKICLDACKSLISYSGALSKMVRGGQKDY